MLNISIQKCQQNYFTCFEGMKPCVKSGCDFIKRQSSTSFLPLAPAVVQQSSSTLPSSTPEVPCPTGESLTQDHYILPLSVDFPIPAGGPVAQPAVERRKQCCILGCPELVAPTMWRLHMDSHLRGLFPGAVPDSWLLDQGLSVCHTCVKLVSTSHLPSHQQKCLAQRSTPLAPMPSSDLSSLDEVCSLKCPTIRFVPCKARLAFARPFSAALMAVISENTATAWLKLFLLPKCVLPSAKHGGRHNKPVSIESLCAMWGEGQFRELWHLAKARASCSKKQ